MKAHAERKHSKFSASGSERWFNCPGSVALSEGMPSKDSIWSIEGTKAHETLEKILRHCAAKGQFLGAKIPSHIMTVPGQTKDMLHYGNHAAGVILGNHWKTPGSELLVETRISLDFIHPAAFGTFDGAVVDHFGTLHVYDYKYGAGHAVSPGTPKDPNLQMAFYGLGLAYRYDWNFKRVRLWIIQPRIRGYTGPTFVEMTIADLRGVWAPTFKKAVRRVEREPKTYVEGSWCHWCNAKSICPLKRQAKAKSMRDAFANAKDE
jgi:hypothetical protein